MANAQLGTVLRHIRGLAARHDANQQTDGVLLRAFAARGDQAAFTALVKRHGPLVLAVCRRVLHNLHDAEDAFQATFLLLARNAAAIRKQESLAGFLHSVAYRTACNARRAAARRRRHEGEARPMRETTPGWDAAWQEVQGILDEEIQRLPEIYRTAFVLCCLEDRSRAEAAAAAGVQEATLRGRLAKARALLQKALARRGVALSAVLAAAALSRSSSAATLPGTLISSTVDAAIRLGAANGSAAGAVSANVAALVKGTQTAMFSSKLKMTTLLLLSFAVAGIGIGLSAFPHAEARPAGAPAQPPAAPAKERPAAAPKDKDGETIHARGRVLDPDGKPFAGAKLYLSYFNRKEMTYPVRATSGADGRFAFTFAKSELDRTYSDNPWSEVIAIAKGYGFDIATIREPGKQGELTLRLVKDVPISGRVLDADGKPVAGAKVRVREVRAFAGESLVEELADFRKGGAGTMFAKSWSGPLPEQPKVVTVGADGRFRLTGLGRERTVRLEVEGPGIHYTAIRVMTRAAETIISPGRYLPSKIYGATFDYLAAPSRPIRGVVRDKDSGKPVAGISISSFSTTHSTRTDKDGRYELLGCLKSKEYQIHVKPAGGQPYLASGFRFNDVEGLTPLTADIALIRGIPLRGRLTDKATGQPIANASVEYRPLYPSPYGGKYPLGGAPSSSEMTGRDGAFALVVLPGPGVIGATAPSREAYMTAQITPKEMKEFFKDSKNWTDTGNSEMFLHVSAGGAAMQGMVQDNYNLLVLIEPAEKTELLKHDLALRPARTLKGHIVGPDDKPLAGAIAYGLEAGSFGERTLKTDAFTVIGLNPKRARQLLFYHKEKNLGFFKEIRGDEPGPLKVQLQPCGSATGRLVDKDGQPLSGVALNIYRFALIGPGGVEAKTDKDGRFRVEGLAPGQKYWLSLLNQPQARVRADAFAVKSGEKKDLGDVTVELGR